MLDLSETEKRQKPRWQRCSKKSVVIVLFISLTLSTLSVLVGQRVNDHSIWNTAPNGLVAGWPVGYAEYRPQRGPEFCDYEPDQAEEKAVERMVVTHGEPAGQVLGPDGYPLSGDNIMQICPSFKSTIKRQHSSMRSIDKYELVPLAKADINWWWPYFIANTFAWIFYILMFVLVMRVLKVPYKKFIMFISYTASLIEKVLPWR